LLDGHTVTGPRWVTERYGFESVPLFVRPGTVLPIGGRDDGPEYDYANGITLHLFGEPRSATVSIPALGGGPGTTFEVVRDDQEVTVRRTTGPAQPWSVVLPDGVDISAHTGGEPDRTATSHGFSPRAGSDTDTITMA
jgi:alpha-D-xyloside xylohydrolase